MHAEGSSLFRLARPLIFRLDAERAHWLTVQSLARAPALASAVRGRPPVADPVSLMGLRFRNRIGLAAGMDKNGEAIAAFARLGFGFVEVGTVTPRPQPGNPKPRLFRAPAQRAIINRLGFNNEGVDACMRRVARAPRDCIIGVNIGKNLDTPVANAAQDYVYCLERAHALADYVTVNVSSPNTPGLRDLQDDAALNALLQALRKARLRVADRDGKCTPVLLKLAPDMTTEQIVSLARIARENGLDGLIATNTTLARPGTLPPQVAAEAGGLSGAPLATLAQSVLEQLRQTVGPDYPLIGVGGIDSEEAARRRVGGGANLLQIYTGLIYEGPSLPGRLAAAVAKRSQI